MSPRPAGRPLALALLFAAVLAAAGCPGDGPGGETDGGPSGDSDGAEVRRVEVDLYFPGPGGRLWPEARELPAIEEPDAAVLQLVNELLAGPTEERFYRPLPESVRVTGVHLDASAVAYVELESPEAPERLPWGSLHERLAAYSLVDTVLLNLPQIEGVVLMWNGQQRESFAGHLDTTRPLTLDRRLLARG